MSDIRLKLKHSWQEDPELLDVHLMEPRQRCGLASLEMLIEYFQHADIGAEEIFHRAEGYHAINDHNDWWHPGQVRVLASYGLLAWRRNWTAPSQDPQYFVEHEGYSPDQLHLVRSQIEAEKNIRENPEKLLLALQTSLQGQAPILLSVKSGFSKNSENHQIVVSGWLAKSRQFLVHDPVHRSGPDTVDEAYLLEYANYWAIFVRPQHIRPTD